MSRVMLTRIALPGMGMSLMDLPAKAKFSGSRISVQAGSAAAQREQLADGVGLDLAFQDVAQVVGAADHGVHAEGVQQFRFWVGPGPRCGPRRTPAWRSGRPPDCPRRCRSRPQSVTAGHIGGAQGVKADGIAAHHRDVQRVGQAAAQCFLRPMMVTLWWWASRLWARYMPTLPPPAIQTFIVLPRFPKRNVSKRRAYLASARNTACSVSTVGQTVSSS